MPLLLCPNDNASMQTVQRAGVEFDMCPTCRGVWLDRGELDKIIERAGGAEAAVPLREPARGAGQAYAEEPRREVSREELRRRDHDDDDYDRRPRKRRESFLSDLFDF